MRPQTEMTASTTLAVAIGKKRSACAQSSVPSFRPIALKKSQFQKFKRYCTNNCRRTTETINAIRSHARHADRPKSVLRCVRGIGGTVGEVAIEARSCGRSNPVASISPASNRRRFSLSLRKSLAADKSLNFASASLWSGCRSGWNLRASLLNASLISTSVAVRFTPRVS